MVAAAQTRAAARELGAHVPSAGAPLRSQSFGGLGRWATPGQPEPSAADADATRPLDQVQPQDGEQAPPTGAQAGVRRDQSAPPAAPAAWTGRGVARPQLLPRDAGVGAPNPHLAPQGRCWCRAAASSGLSCSPRRAHTKSHAGSSCKAPEPRCKGERATAAGPVPPGHREAGSRQRQPRLCSVKEPARHRQPSRRAAGGGTPLPTAPLSRLRAVAQLTGKR